MSGGMRPAGMPPIPDMPEPEAKPKALTEEQKRTEANKQKEAQDFAAHASATLPGTWRRLADKDNPYGQQTAEEKLAEENSGGLKAGRLSLGLADPSKLVPGVYRNDDTGVDLRLKDDKSLSFPSPIEYHKGMGHSRTIKSGVIRTDADFLKKYGGGVNFMKKHLGAQKIYFDVGEAILSAARIKNLIAHAGKEPAADLEFGPKITGFIDNLPPKDKDEINKMLIELSTKAKLTSIAKGTHTEEQDLEAAKNNIDRQPGLHTDISGIEVREEGLPVLEDNPLPELKVDETIESVGETLENIDKHIVEGRVALNEMESNLNSYNEILKTPAGDLIKSPVPELDIKREAEGLDTRHPTLFHQVKNASDESANARSDLLTTIDTEITNLQASKNACQEVLKTLKDDDAIKTPPVSAADKAKHKERTDKIKALEDKVAKADTDISSLKTLRDKNRDNHNGLAAKMADKEKAVNNIISPPKKSAGPAGPAP